jgi:hypothetical protein
MTNVEKWKDLWFSNLSPNAKLLFFYLVENCDNAGFFEINKKFILFYTGLNENQLMDAVVELKKSYIKSKDGTKLWFKNFLKYQKKLPLNIANNSHKQVISTILDNLQDENKFKGNETINSILPTDLQLPITQVRKKKEQKVEPINEITISDNSNNILNITLEQPISSIKPNDDFLNSNPFVKNNQSEIESKSKRFVKPSSRDVYEYMVENEFEFAKIESVRFYDFYESNGWRIGKNSMKDWKATVRNWMKNYYERNRISTPKLSKLQAIQEAHESMENKDWNEEYKDFKNE